MGAIVIIIFVVLIAKWAFGGTTTSSQERCIKASNDCFEGKITHEEYMQIRHEEAMKFIKKHSR